MSKRRKSPRSHAQRATVDAHPPRRWSRVVVVAGSLLIVALALLLRYGSARWWWLEMVRYFPLPLLLAPVGVLVGLSWRLGRVFRVLSLATLALLLTEVMGLVVGHADEGDGGFRFMTYNVKSYLATRAEDGFGRIAWEIATQNPDVIVMQDAQAIAGHPAAAAPIRAALAGRATYVEGQYLVASRFPMRDCGPGVLSPEPDGPEYVRCTLTIDGHDVDVFTAHLESPREGLNAARGRRPGGLEEWQFNFEERLSEAGMLLRGIVGARHPVIVAGDLNADEHSPVVRQLLATGLRDAFGSAGLGYGYTYGHDLRPGFSFLRIDHVLVAGSIGVRDCSVGGRDASEHRPVIAELLVERH